MPAAEPGEGAPGPHYPERGERCPIWLHLVVKLAACSDPVTYLRERIAGERRTAYTYEDYVPGEGVCIKDDDFLGKKGFRENIRAIAADHPALTVLCKTHLHSSS